MNNKTSAAGWVIEVRRSDTDLKQVPPQYTYYNVAFTNADKATETAVAAARKAGFVGTGHHVRSLSDGEIAVLQFKPGDVQLA